MNKESETASIKLLKPSESQLSHPNTTFKDSITPLTCLVPSKKFHGWILKHEIHYYRNFKAMTYKLSKYWRFISDLKAGAQFKREKLGFWKD